MRIWNLSDAAQISDTVVEKFTNPKSMRHAPLKSTQKPSPMKLWFGVATLALNVSVAAAAVNEYVVHLPTDMAAVTISVPNQKPPLAHMFSHRFGPDWAVAQEEGFITAIARRVDLLEERNQPRDIVRFVASNQQEDLTVETPRLSQRRVENLIIKRNA